jgi:two-component system, cell cycle response regulator
MKILIVDDDPIHNRQL